ncbi:5-hydroxytryptamine receptor-like [Stylophora pistillata]|uniref:5-hydroxytryptamine receptor-like n=1 Tax=Stylophora pistillata TaxID=50429 RepID=UPI000C057916|nr:5-hydroxytryptamine receptor-like [Stylophora pistillata]
MNGTPAENKSSVEWSHNFYYRPGFIYPVATCHILIIAVAGVGNLLVLYTIVANRKLRRNPTNIFIFSLALSDLLTVTLVVPFEVEGLFLHWIWNHGEIMCRAWITLYLITVPVSILTLLAVSVDRYKILSDPTKRFRRCGLTTRKEGLTVSLIIWLYSSLIASLPVMGWRTSEKFVYNSCCYFPLVRLYFIISSVLNFILPILVTSGIYLRICLIVRSYHKKLGADNSKNMRSTAEKKMYLRNIQAAKTLAFLVVAFFCCWLLYSCVSLFSLVCGESCIVFIPPEVRTVLLMIGYLNSALNPLLLAFLDKKFRAALSCKNISNQDL